jgi:hypothetical protein
VKFAVKRTRIIQKVKHPSSSNCGKKEIALTRTVGGNSLTRHGQHRDRNHDSGAAMEAAALAGERGQEPRDEADSSAAVRSLGCYIEFVALKRAMVRLSHHAIQLSPTS